MESRSIQSARSEGAAAGRPTRGGPQPLHVTQIADALLKLSTAAMVAGVSEATLYRRAKDDPTFPPLVRIGARCTRIRAGDLVAWLAAHVRSSVAGSGTAP